LEYAIRKAQENQDGLKLNGTHHLLAYSHDVSLLGHNIDANKEVGLKLNLEKTKFMFVSHHQNAGQNRNIQIANRMSEHVSQFKYFGMTVVSQHLTQKEIKRRLNSGNICYHSVQNLLSSRLLSKNPKIKIYKTIILPALLYGMELGLCSDIKGGTQTVGV
jgi:hypothetical protein